MNRLITLIIIIFTALPLYAQITDREIKDIFPKVEQLEGGAKLWLNTGQKKTTKDNYTAFSTTYSYYSGKTEKLMNIIRKKNYETNVAVYSFRNFVDANQYFKELTKDAPKRRSQQVRFGERGLFFLYPKSGYINDADFYLVFINKTFVVWMYSNDGFALMDIANPVNKSLNNLILNHSKMYMVKNITVEVMSEGFETQTKNIKFTNEYPSSITVSGKVFTKDLDPMRTATVNILETGDSLYTDKDGTFSHTIMLDGIEGRDIKLGTNFYMEEIGADKMTRLESGLIEVTLKNGKNREFKQLWKIETAGDKIFGNAYIKTSSGLKDYPLSGNIENRDKLNLRLDCSKSGSDFRCEQIFRGQLTPEKISGSWSGTGGGGIFSADRKKFSEQEREIVATRQNIEMKTYTVRDGVLLTSDDSLLNIGSGTDSTTMIYVKPTKSFGKSDEIKSVSRKLILTHLPENQSGNLSIFRYDIINDGDKLRLGKSRFMSQLHESEEPYKVEIDISNIGSEAFAIGTVAESESSGNHLFSGINSKYESLKPYVLITEYVEATKSVKSSKPFSMSKSEKKSADLLSDKNKPKPDGKVDYCFDATINYPNQKLTDFQLQIKDKIRRVYNTNPLDIYPVVGIMKDDKLLNEPNGGISYNLSQEVQKLKICINGSYRPSKKSVISYRYNINGKSFEGIAE